MTQGICLVPEDRKRHGIDPLQALAPASRWPCSRTTPTIGQIDAGWQQIQKSIDRMRIKTASPNLPIKEPVRR